MGLEYEEREYEDGPWTTEGWKTDAEVWWDAYPHDESIDLPNEDEVKYPIQIEPLKDGFVVALDVRRAFLPDELAFTDRVDAAEWLLGWLGFEDEIVESVHDILAGLWDADELYDILPDCVAGVDYDELGDRDAHVQYRHCMDWPTKWWEKDEDYKRAVGVAEAAWAYVKGHTGAGYNKLAEAVKKWRGTEGG